MHTEDTTNWFDDGTNFHEGKAIVQLNNTKFYINTKGEDVFPGMRFDTASIFSDGYALVEKDGTIGYLDHYGKIHTGTRTISTALFFSEGLAFVRFENDEKWVCVDKDLKVLFTLENYMPTNPYKDGFAIIRREKVRNEVEIPDEPVYEYNFIDKEGKILSNEWFDIVYPFSEGYAVIGHHLYHDIFRFNYIDINGNKLSEMSFAEALDFREGLGAVALEDDNDGPSFSWCYIDGTGKLVMPRKLNILPGSIEEKIYPRYSKAYPFSEGIACIGWEYADGSDSHLIDHDGNILYSFYDGKCILFGYSEGFAGFADSEISPIEPELRKEYFVDRNGKNIFGKFFDEIWPFSEGYAAVRVGTKYNYIDKNGEYLIK